jgi:hypothetical protein
MNFDSFFEKCRTESTVSDFESYLAHCIFGKKATRTQDAEEFTVETYSLARDKAFEQRDVKAAKLLYGLADAAKWQEGEWEGALR